MTSPGRTRRGDEVSPGRPSAAGGPPDYGFAVAKVESITSATTCRLDGDRDGVGSSTASASPAARTAAPRVLGARGMPNAAITARPRTSRRFRRALRRNGDAVEKQVHPAPTHPGRGRDDRSNRQVDKQDSASFRSTSIIVRTTRKPGNCRLAQGEAARPPRKSSLQIRGDQRHRSEGPYTSARDGRRGRYREQDSVLSGIVFAEIPREEIGGTNPVVQSVRLRPYRSGRRPGVPAHAKVPHRGPKYQGKPLERREDPRAGKVESPPPSLTRLLGRHCCTTRTSGGAVSSNTRDPAPRGTQHLPDGISRRAGRRTLLSSTSRCERQNVRGRS